MLRILFIVLTYTLTASAAVTIDKTAYKGWSNCYRISNGEVELIVTTDVGPRVIRYGFVGGQNLFKEFTEQLGKSGEKEWMARGGHRIWMAPEDAKQTYALDNTPIKIQSANGIVTLTSPVEALTGLEKQILVKLAVSGSKVEIVHRLRNAGRTVKEFAPWALTMMAQGGYGITGFPPRGTHPAMLAATNPLVMWAFSDLSDKRWTFTKKYLVLRQDAKNTGQPQKIGLFNPNTWGAYYLNGELFLKQSTAQSGKPYPDFNASFETFTSADFLELETLGPLARVEPGKALEHLERWSLHRNIKIPSFSDESLDAIMLPILGK